MSDIAKMIAIAKKFGGGSSTPAPVVILPETELTAEGAQYMLYTPPENAPIGGGNYRIVWDDVEYFSPALDVTETLGEGTPAFAFGNSAVAFGEDGAAEIGNPAPGAPYFLALIPNGKEETEGGQTAYGMLMATEEPTAPVLSIVQIGEASADSGNGTSDFIVTGMLNTTTFSVSNVSKTYDEVHAAAEERKNIKLYLDVQGQGSYVVMPLTQMTPTVLAFGSIISEGARWRAQYTADGMTVKVD